MFYINHNFDSFTLIDCCLPDDNKPAIIKDIKKARSDKGITRFLSTYPDEDHILGLKQLDTELELVNFYCVKNNVTKEDETDDFKHYFSLRDAEKAFFIHRGVTRKWMNEGDDTRATAAIRVLRPVVDNKDFRDALKAAEMGESPNNISAVLSYRADSTTFMWMGDLETDFMGKIANQVSWPKVDILFAPHHGRNSGRVPHRRRA
jgi:beta-lactamase superfamily II metal-dependent hydrolase